MKLLIVFISVLCFLTACSPETQQRTQENIAPESQLTKVSETPRPRATLTPSTVAVTASLTPTHIPPTITQAPSLAPTANHSTPTISAATLSAEATRIAFGVPCETPSRHDWSEISSDGKWIAIVCYSDGERSAYLHVFSLYGTESWQIFYKDYAADWEFNRGNRFTPFHWSHDGRFLYATSQVRWDGWFGLSDTQALIRLTLKNGQIDQIVNLIPKRWYTAWFSFSPSDQYLLYIPQDERPGLHLIELNTWTTQLINLEDDRSNAAGFEIWSPDEKEILLLVGRGAQDQGIYSLLLVNLIDSSQTILIDDMESWQDLMPDAWYDEDHVALRNYGWSNSFGEKILLNVRTGELSEFVQP